MLRAPSSPQLATSTSKLASVHWRVWYAGDEDSVMTQNLHLALHCSLFDTAGSVCQVTHRPTVPGVLWYFAFSSSHLNQGHIQDTREIEAAAS